MSQIETEHTPSGGISREDPRLALIADRLKREYGAERVILFGSVARGAATEDSDVDLFIVAPARESLFQRRVDVRRIVRDLTRGLAISPLVLTAGEVARRIEMGDQFVDEIVRTGLDL
jgi:uncharacterized protein